MSIRRPGYIDPLLVFRTLRSQHKRWILLHNLVGGKIGHAMNKLSHVIVAALASTVQEDDQRILFPRFDFFGLEQAIRKLTSLGIGVVVRFKALTHIGRR